MSDRLTDEQLATIAAFTDEYVAPMGARESLTVGGGLVLLLAEVRRLRAVEQRVQALAEGNDWHWIEVADEPGFTCEQVSDAIAGIKRNWRGGIIEGPTEENQS